MSQKESAGVGGEASSHVAQSMSGQKTCDRDSPGRDPLSLVSEYCDEKLDFVSCGSQNGSDEYMPAT